MPPLSRILEDGKRQLHFLRATLDKLQSQGDEAKLMKKFLIKYVEQALNNSIVETPEGVHVFFYYYGGGEIRVIFFSEKESYTQWKSFQGSAFGKQAFTLSRQIYTILTKNNTTNVDDTSNNKMINSNKVQQAIETSNKSDAVDTDKICASKANQNGNKVVNVDSKLCKGDYESISATINENDKTDHFQDLKLLPLTVSNLASYKNKNDNHDDNQLSPAPSSHNESSETVSSMCSEPKEEDIEEGTAALLCDNAKNFSDAPESTRKRKSIDEPNDENFDSQSDSKVSYNDNLDSRFEVIMEDSLGEVSLTQPENSEFYASSPTFSIERQTNFDSPRLSIEKQTTNNGHDTDYEPLKYLATEKMVEIPVKRKRGRPRKNPFPIIPRLVPNSESHSSFQPSSPITSPNDYLINHGTFKKM